MDFPALGLAALLVIGWINRNAWLMPLLRRCGQCLLRVWRWWRSDPVAVQAAKAVESAAGRLEMLRLRLEALEAEHCTAIVITDEKGELTWANAAFLELTGLPLTQVLGGNWLNAVHQDDRAALEDGWERAVADKRDFDHCYRYWSFARSKETWARASVRVARNPITSEPVGWIATVEPLDARPFPSGSQCPAGHWQPPIQ